MSNIIKNSLHLVVILLFAASCETMNLESKYSGKSTSTIHEKAQEFLAKKDYHSAKKLFHKLYTEHPASKFAASAMLGESYALIQLEKEKYYEEALGTLDGFLKIYPVHENADYAHYLKALAYYNRLNNVGKQLKLAIEAKNNFEIIAEKYPDTEYGKLAVEYLETVKNHIASHYLYIGNYYLNNYEPIAAIGRYEQVLREYPESKVKSHALVHLVEAYTMLGIKDIAVKYNEQLKREFPKESRLKHTEEILTQFKTRPRSSSGS